MASPNTKRDVSKSYSDLYTTPKEAMDVAKRYRYEVIHPSDKPKPVIASMPPQTGIDRERKDTWEARGD